MKNIAILFGSLLLASTAAMAQSSLLDAAQTLQNTQNAVDSVKTAPEALKSGAEDAAKQKLIQATPSEVTQGVETVNKVKSATDAAPKSTGAAVNAVEGKAKQKAAEKALDLLH